MLIIQSNSGVVKKTMPAGSCFDIQRADGVSRRLPTECTATKREICKKIISKKVLQISVPLMHEAAGKKLTS